MNVADRTEPARSSFVARSIFGKKNFPSRAATRLSLSAARLGRIGISDKSAIVLEGSIRRAPRGKQGDETTKGEQRRKKTGRDRVKKRKGKVGEPRISNEVGASARFDESLTFEFSAGPQSFLPFRPFFSPSLPPPRCGGLRHRHCHHPLSTTSLGRPVHR